MIGLKVGKKKRKNLVLFLCFFIAFFFSCENENFELTFKKSIIRPIKATLVDNKSKEVIIGEFEKFIDNKDTLYIYLNSLNSISKINKVYVTGTPYEIEYFTTYLGETKVNGTKTHLFNYRYSVQCALEKHRHSSIIFKDSSGAKLYDMGIPECLPFDMKKGELRYIYKNDTISMKIEHYGENGLLLKER